VIAGGGLVLAAGHALLLASVAEIGVRGDVGVLAPALALIGAGMGLLITPLMTIVLTDLDPETAGAASGMLNTAQQVGNSIGVAGIGVIFFGALDHGYSHAFELSLACLAGLLVAVAALSRLLPAPRTLGHPAIDVRPPPHQHCPGDTSVSDGLELPAGRVGDRPHARGLVLDR
jgi:MFS family permease